MSDPNGDHIERFRARIHAMSMDELRALIVVMRRHTNDLFEELAILQEQILDRSLRNQKRPPR